MYGYPVNACYDSGNRSRAPLVEHLHRPQPGAGRHTYHADVVINGGGDARDVRPVAVVVLAFPLAGAGDCDSSDAIKIWVLRAYPRIEDSNVYVHALVDAVNLGCGAQVGVDAVDPGRNHLRRLFGALLPFAGRRALHRVHNQVGFDKLHPRVRLHGSEPLNRYPG